MRMSRPKTTPKSAPKSAPQNAPQNTSETVSQSAAQDTPQGTPETGHQSAAQGMPATAPQSAAPAPVPMVEVRIDKMLDGSTKTKAFASANLFGQFAIHGLRVVETDKGRFIAMPQESYEKNGEKKYTDTFHPITVNADLKL